MIKNWKILQAFTEQFQDRLLVSIACDKEDIRKICLRFKDICDEPFHIAEGEYNWGFYIFSSDDEKRIELEKYLAEQKIDTIEEEESGTVTVKASEKSELKDILKELSSVIDEVTKKGLTRDEVKAIELAAANDAFVQAPFEVPRKDEGKKENVKKAKKILPEKVIKKEEPEEEVIKIGCLYPSGSEKRFDIFIDTITNVIDATTKFTMRLEKTVVETYDPNIDTFKLDAIQKIYRIHNIEILLIFTDEYYSSGIEKTIIEKLKKKLKRKIICKIIPLSRLTQRSLYVDIVVEIALFKQKGLEYFHVQ